MSRDEPLDPQPLPRAARAALYRLFADLLTHEVDRPRLAALREVGAVLERAAPELCPWLEKADDRALLALRVEFARLFLTPKGVPPQASAWLGDDAAGSADGVARLTHRTMAALELEQTRHAGSLPLDHLGLLYAVASDALTSPVPERRALGEHIEQETLGPWVCAFARSLGRSREPLYRALGQAMCELHCDDGGTTAPPLPDVQTGSHRG